MLVLGARAAAPGASGASGQRAPWALGACAAQAGPWAGGASWARPGWRHGGGSSGWRADGRAGLHTEGASVQNLLDSMQAVKLRDSLEVAADSRPFMSYPELLDFIIHHGAADTPDEAHKRADALVHAGVVLRFNGIVYLKPQEVAELVYRVLPTDPAHAQRNLVAIEAELAAMEKQHKALRSTAQRWPRFWLWAGCGVLTLQVVAFAYLTWWELSWDVMEPIAYMLSLTYSLLAYVYFLVRGSYFDYGPFEETMTQQQLEKKMAEKGFDLDRFQHLLRTRERYRRYLSRAGPGGGGGEAGAGEHFFTPAKAKAA
ncbi:calcium uniporter [Scenedesmus sp. PABB004]|nr:calcium uniporter [Scenedesmus sp. PABB004]